MSGEDIVLVGELSAPDDLDVESTSYVFVPKSMPGAKYPKFEGQECLGFDISQVSNDFVEQKGLNLNYLIRMYTLYPEKEKFFLENGFFDKLAGGTQLREDIIGGKTAEAIKSSWQDDLNAFKSIRSKYLIYPDFE